MDRVEVEFRPSQLPGFTVRDLLAGLRAVGIDAEMAPVPEERGAVKVTELVLRYVGELLADHTADALVSAAVAWIVARRGKGSRGPWPRTVKLYGPDGSVAREVEVPKDDAGDDERSG